MSCPFPGIDPWLEESDFWQGFHNGFIQYCLEQLQPRLTGPYVATVEVRIYFDPDPESTGTGEYRIPDLQVVRLRGAPVPEQRSGSSTTRRGTLLELNPVERREAFINIVELPSRRLVTSIELISPTNKRPGTGRSEYRAKQSRFLGQGVNLVEIDLLRSGSNTVLAPLARLEPLKPYDYLAGIYRGHEPLRYEAITWSLRETLPTIPVPLDEGTPEVELDLADAYDRVYSVGAYSRLLSYSQQPHPPLGDDDARWAEALLHQAGLRVSED